MLVELPRIIVPVLLALLQVFTAALSLGLMPALWILWRRRCYGLLWRWGVFTLVCLALAVYVLPRAHESWWWWVTIQGTAPSAFKWVALWLGYFVGVLFAPMIIPEPLRIARRRMHQERRADSARRGYRVP
jgi:hypothetical protein